MKQFPQTNARIIVTGANSEVPRRFFQSLAVAIDGAEFGSWVELAPHQEKCGECNGQGTIWVTSGYGPHRRKYSTCCSECHGEGFTSNEEGE